MTSVAFQVSITMGPGGHFEKYDRISIIRPMRTYGYLDSTPMRGYASVWGVAVCALLMKELRAIKKAGLRSHFLYSSKAFWNWWEVIFYYCVFRSVTATSVFTDYTLYMEAEMEKLQARSCDSQQLCLRVYSDLYLCVQATGLLEHTFVDLIEFKKACRSCLKAISMTVFVSIFKTFKYLSLSIKLNFMWRIMLKAKGDILAFGIIFVLFMITFGYLATVLFGYELRIFHNWCACVTTPLGTHHS